MGVVRGVTPGMCSVFLPDEDRTVNIPAEHLKPVQPVRGDTVKVIMGKFLRITPNTPHESVLQLRDRLEKVWF